ncbi:RBBP9/YdeN family alpha/beta hydrolase [Epilithonimonas hungarica]|uniref:Alpha/beta hydrolase n=1 Tax=Epilithonimonas hungarica TaxID=454006 RepID=A0A1G7RQ93_9FLAO|nr:alpha/beta hydrolase [Epilithonimonas hungarica]SDG12833.1 hypothetical protein SAMN05421825_2739 [Epilithonimonas hungarica]
MENKIQYFIIPGLGNSGPKHWQSYFETFGENFHRINQKEWDAPDCTDWIDNIEETISRFETSNVVLIGHSLGCTTIVKWFEKYKKQIKGALMVAPSDIESPIYTFPATGFSPIPLEKLPFTSIVVASSDDIWVSLEKAKFLAENWGSEFINIGNAGHINADSGFGEWKEGLEMLKKFENENLSL